MKRSSRTEHSTSGSSFQPSHCLAFRDELVARVLATEQLDEPCGLVVVTRRWGVERCGLVAGGGLLRLEYLLDGGSGAWPPHAASAIGQAAWRASVSRLTTSVRSWSSRGMCSAQPLSRKWRFSSPRMVGAA